MGQYQILYSFVANGVGGRIILENDVFPPTEEDIYKCEKEIKTMVNKLGVEDIETAITGFHLLGSKQENNVANAIRKMTDEEMAAFFAKRFCFGRGEDALYCWLTSNESDSLFF